MANPTLKLLQQQVHRLQRAAENPAQLEAELPDVLQNLQTTLQTLSQEPAAASNGQSEAREKYEFIVNTSQEFMTLINRDYIYKAVNNSYCKAHNKPRREIVGKSVADVWGQASFESHIKPHLDECFSGRQTRYRCWFEFARLGRRYFDVAYYPYFDDTQTVTDAVVISRDMTDYKVMEEELRKAHDELEHRVEKRTAELEQANKQLRQEIKERKRMEQTLRHSEEKYRAVVEQSADCIFLVDVESNQIIEANPALQTLLDYTVDELLNLNIYDIIAHSKESINANARQIILEGEQYLGERYYRKQSGQIVEVEIKANLISYQHRDVICVVARDITERKQAEKALQESEKRYKQLLESVTDYIYSVKIVEGQPASTQHGPGCLAVTGYTSQEYQTDSSLWYNMVHPDDRDAVITQANKMMAGELAAPLEHRIIHKSGDVRWVRNTPVPRHTPQGQLEAYDGLITDITDRKRVEQMLRESEAKFRTLAETTAAGIFIYQGSKNSYVNPATEALTGYSQQELLAMNFWEVIHSDFREPIKKQGFARQQGQAIPPRHELKLLAKDGTERWIDVTLGTIEFDGETAVLGTAFDITGRKQAEQERERLLVAEQEQRILAETLGEEAQQEIKERVRAEKELRRVGEINQAILNAIPDTIIYFDHQGRPITYKSGDHGSFSGQTLNDALTHNTGSRLNLPPDLLPLVQHYITQTLDDDAVHSFEYELDSPQGKLVFECRLVASGSNQVLAIVRNITKRKQAEVKLAQERNLLRTLIDNLPDYIVVKDRQRQFIISNPAHAQLLGAPGPDQVVGKTSHDFFPPDAADRYAAEDRMIFETGQSIINKERAFLNQQGDPRWRLTTKVPLRESNGEITGLISIGRDITQRKQAEAALQESEANLRAIFDNSQQAFLLINRDKEIQAFNKTARAGIKMIGGQNIQKGASFDEYIPKAELEEFNDNFETALNGGSVQVEKQVKLRNREQWFEIHFNPVFAENDQVIGVCFSTVNIDERKRAADALAANEARLWAEMRSMLAVTRALVTEIKINTLLEFIMEQAKSLMEADETAVLLLSDDGQYLETANPTESALGIRKGAQLPVQGSLAGVALTSQQVQISSGLSEYQLLESLLDFLQPAQAHSILCAPLIFQRNSLGVLLAWNTREKRFAASDSLLMEVFADQAALALYNAELHAQNRRLAVEQERHRLARDLHDSVTQSLYSMGLAAQASLRLLDKNAKTKVREPIEYIHSLSQTALAEMREHLYHLHPTGLDKENLIEVLSHHCDSLSKHYSLNIEFVANLESSLSVRQRDALYYTTREALWNVVKHANASRVDIDLQRKGDQIFLTIKDDGDGFDPAEVSGAETMGLRNIQERVKLIGGDFELQTQPGQGTELVARLPLRPT